MYKFNKLPDKVKEELREFYSMIDDTAKCELDYLTSKGEVLSDDAGFYDVEYNFGKLSCQVDILEYLTFTKQLTHFGWLKKYFADSDKYECETLINIVNGRVKDAYASHYEYPPHFDEYNVDECNRLINKWSENIDQLFDDITYYCNKHAKAIHDTVERYHDAISDDKTFASMLEGELFTIVGIRCDYTFIQKGEADERIKALLNHIYSVSLADELVVVETTKNNVYDSVVKVEETYTFGCDSFHTKSDPTTCFVVRDATFDIRSLYNTFVRGYTRGQFYEVTNDELL